MTGAPNPLWCVHRDITPTDDDGRAVCIRCGATVAVPGPLTEKMLSDTFAALMRQPHTSSCVRIDGHWVCAKRCSEYRP